MAFIVSNSLYLPYSAGKKFDDQNCFIFFFQWMFQHFRIACHSIFLLNKSEKLRENMQNNIYLLKPS